MLIFFGMIVGGLVFIVVGSYGMVVVVCVIIVLVICGNIVVCLIFRVDVGDLNLKINWNLLLELLVVLCMVCQQKVVCNLILGVFWFWFVGIVLILQLLVYVVINLGGQLILYIFVLVLFLVGIGVGLLLCEKLLVCMVEIGLVLLGVFGMIVFLFDLYFVCSGEVMVYGLIIVLFLQQFGSICIVIDLVGIGLFIGIFVVLLFVLIQSCMLKVQMLCVFVVFNIQNLGFIVVVVLLLLVVYKLLYWIILQQFLVLVIVNVLVVIYIFIIVFEFLMCFFSWLMVCILYWLCLYGIEVNVFDEGVVLLVCNYVSYMDVLILLVMILCLVCFVMYYRIFNILVMCWIFWIVKVILIVGVCEDLVLMQCVFDEIDVVLVEGELVCIFFEGVLICDGEMVLFKFGVEKIFEWWLVLVVLMVLCGMWLSMWSCCDSCFGCMWVLCCFCVIVEVVVVLVVDGYVICVLVLEVQVWVLCGDYV